MVMFNFFKKKPVAEDEYTEIQLLEIELQIANDDRLYAQLVYDKMVLTKDHDRKYAIHKVNLVRDAKLAVNVAKTKLKNANIKRNEELVMKADIKKYERDRRDKIASKTCLARLKRVIKARYPDDYESIMIEVKEGV